jgi:outer membrane autotransporter protein
MKKLLLLGLSSLAFTAHAWEPTYYVGSGASSWQFHPHQYGHNFTIGTLEGQAGIDLTPYTALEARLGFGLNTARETLTIEGLDVETELEATYFGSIYFKPQLRNDRASLYGLLGMTTIELDVNDGLESDTYTDMSYGIGVSFVLHPHVDLTAEWKKLINADEFDARGGTIGFNYRF